MIRGVIFDLDGVLLDSMCIWQDLGGQFLRTHGIAPEPGLSELLFSMSMEQGAQYLSRSYPLGMPPEAVAAGIQELLRDFYYNCVQPKPGAQALLEFLSTKRIPMAAATSSPRSHVTHALTRTGLIGFLSPFSPPASCPPASTNLTSTWKPQKRWVPPLRKRWCWRILSMP